MLFSMVVLVCINYVWKQFKVISQRDACNTKRVFYSAKEKHDTYF